MMSLAVEPVDDIARPCVRENSVMMPSIINGWSSTKPMETTIGLLQIKIRYKNLIIRLAYSKYRSIKRPM
jgi:hypothetical protein